MTGYLFEAFGKPVNELKLLSRSQLSYSLFAIYQDGHTEEITQVADVDIQNPEVLLVEAGQIMALKDGESTVTFSYKSTFWGTPVSDCTYCFFHLSVDCPII